MGGHVAEKLLCGEDKITNGCGSDLQNATNYAYQAVRKSGMFGDLVSYNSTDFQESSEEYNAKIDFAVKKILDVSSELPIEHESYCIDLIIFLLSRLGII